MFVNISTAEWKKNVSRREDEERRISPRGWRTTYVVVRMKNDVSRRVLAVCKSARYVVLHLRAEIRSPSVQTSICCWHNCGRTIESNLNNIYLFKWKNSTFYNTCTIFDLKRGPKASSFLTDWIKKRLYLPGGRISIIF